MIKQARIVSEKIKDNFLIRSNELGIYFKALLNKRIEPKNNFIIFSSNRTGSTLLLMLLKSHPEIDCKGEIFHEFTKLKYKKVAFPHHFIDGNKPNSAKVFGFSLKTQHINIVLSKKYKNIISDLNKKGWKIIYLKRLNIFRQAVSHLIATINHQWHYFPRKPINKKKVNIDCNKLLETIIWFEKLACLEKKILTEINHIKIIYEKDLLEEKNHQKTCDNISQFLGITPNKVSTDIRKISSGKLCDQILNYEEVMTFFINTKYSEYITD